MVGVGEGQIVVQRTKGEKNRLNWKSILFGKPLILSDLKVNLRSFFFEPGELLTFS